MGLYRKASPDELDEAFGRSANKSDAPANKSIEVDRRLPKFDYAFAGQEPRIPKPRGRPVKSTGDPAKDKRNAQQAELMRKRRAAK